MLIIMMDGTRLRVSPEEAAAVTAAANDGRKLIAVAGCVINSSSISGIYPEDVATEMTSGRLHDGTKVVRKFGRWCDAGNDKLVLTPAHYPELARDQAISEREWEEQVMPLQTVAERRAKFDDLAARRQGTALGPGQERKELPAPRETKKDEWKGSRARAF